MVERARSLCSAVSCLTFLRSHSSSPCALVSLNSPTTALSKQPRVTGLYQHYTTGVCTSKTININEDTPHMVPITYSRHILLIAILASCDSTCGASFAFEMCCGPRPNCGCRSHKLINYTLRRKGIAS